MLNIAQKKIKTNNIRLLNVDLRNISNDIQGDLVVCYRLLNLICRETFLQIFENILKISKKYVIFSIRVVETEHIEDIKIEDKIYIHNMSDIKTALTNNNFSVVSEYSFNDAKPGTYKIIFCKNENLTFNNCRINKAFKIIYNYIENGIPKKIYQVKDSEHANYIYEITRKSKISNLFPEIYKIEENFIHAQWIHGTQTHSNSWDEIVELLIKIQQLDSDTYSSFDYVEDLIIPRFYLATPIIGFEFYKRITSLILEGGKQEQYKVSHPDIIPGNVITSSSGYKIIDNELLCRTKHHNIDILNILKNIPHILRIAIFNKYIYYSSIRAESYINKIDYLNAIWIAREIGSFIINGNIPEIQKILKKFHNNEIILPIDIK